jgi:DNA polymerase-3 subunit alpha
MTDFVSLHNHTDYSFASAWTSLKVSKKVGVKLIIGCECYFQENSDDKFRHIILLATNAVGYRNILTINKLGFDRSQIGKRVYSIINWELLEKYSEGVICLTSCGNGIISQLITNNKMDEVRSTILRLKSIFGDRFGLEVQPNNMIRNASIYTDQVDQKYLNRSLIALGHEYNVRVVPTCNTHYVKRDEYETHDALLAIGSHQTSYSNFRLKYTVPDFYLKSAEEVKKFFARNYGEEYAEEICANTIYFANMCEQPDWIDPKFSNPSGKELPVFPVIDEPDYLNFCEWKKNQIIDVQQLEDDKLFLRYRTEIEFNNFVKDMSDEDKKVYSDRIAEELDVLEYHGFSSYMLIVADYINWARKNGIPVGAGRGSVGGCLIAYLLGIHQADPIKYNLIFARFHNKEKSSFPDIDTDFAPSGRDKVQQYLKKKYGDDHVAHVSNVNTITPKVYVKDIARIFELGGSKENAVQLGNQVADHISADIHTIDDALVKSPLFAEYCEKYPEFIKYKDICGKYRAWSTHAGGIIISARPLTGLVPIRKDKDGAWALEYDKDKAEENGLVKMDTLGLSTLDVVGSALELIGSEKFSLNQLDYSEHDKQTYDLISKGDTFCVFQLGTSGGTIDLCRRIKPMNISDISIINSLARPSARDIRDKFIATRSGKKKFKLLHPRLARAFNDTYGFGLYEESLMYLAQDIAGWSLHEADRLRKLTKEKGKNPKKVALWRTDFINGAVKKGVNETIAIRIWEEIISNFQGYGFNNSVHFLEMVDIYTSDGKFLQKKIMDEVMIGDYVRSRDENTKKDIFIEVTDKHDHGILPLVEIELDTGEKVKCTMDHKFRTKETGEMLPLWMILKYDLSIVVMER